MDTRPIEWEKYLGQPANAAWSDGVIHPERHPGRACPQSPVSGTGGPSAARGETPKAEAVQLLLPCTHPGSALYRSTKLEAPLTEARVESRPGQREMKRRKTDGWRSKRRRGLIWRDWMCPRGCRETRREHLSRLGLQTSRRSTPLVQSPSPVSPGPGTQVLRRASELKGPQKGQVLHLWVPYVQVSLPPTSQASQPNRLLGLHPLHPQLLLPRCFSPFKTPGWLTLTKGEVCSLSWCVCHVTQ